MCVLSEEISLNEQVEITEVSAASDARVSGESRVRHTREQILRATHGCLIEVGFEKITTRRIAEAAQVNIATLHYHFGSKEALLSAAVAFASAESERAIREAIASAPNAAIALEVGLKKAWDLIRERNGILRYDLIVRGLRDEDARRDANAIYSGFRQMTREIFDRHIRAGGTLQGGLTPTQMAQYYVAVIDGVVLQYTLSDDDEAAKLGLSLILNQARQVMGLGNGVVNDESARF